MYEPLEDLTIVRKKLWEGMSNTIDDVKLFSDDASKGIYAEYLLTVNLAKSLANKTNIEGYNNNKIILEKSTKQFARECLPKLKRIGNPLKKGSTILLKDIPKNYRKGKRDIAVYTNKIENFGDTPLYCIEVKSFNSPTSKIKSDLIRNMIFLNLQANTGIGYLKNAFFVGLESRTITKKSNQLKLQEAIKEKYIKILKSIDLISSETQYNIEVENLSFSDGVVESEIQQISELDFEEVLVLDTSKKYNYYGVVIHLSKS